MRAFALGVILTAAGCARPTAPAPPEVEPPPVVEVKAKPPEPAREVPAALAAIFKERNALHKRQTGARLTISAKWEKGAQTEYAIAVKWMIDYDGPRRPFTVLTPALSFTAPEQTAAHFWYLDAAGTPVAFKLASGKQSIVPAPHKQKGWFSTAPDGKLVTGTIIVGGRRHLKHHVGRELDPGEPSLWVQLEHAPIDRGDGFEWVQDPRTGVVSEGAPWTLDAWTGKLWSPVVEVAGK
jgi:hypothetical protein